LQSVLVRNLFCGVSPKGHCLRVPVLENEMLPHLRSKPSGSVLRSRKRWTNRFHQKQNTQYYPRWAEWTKRRSIHLEGQPRLLLRIVVELYHPFFPRMRGAVPILPRPSLALVLIIGSVRETLLQAPAVVRKCLKYKLIASRLLASQLFRFWTCSRSRPRRFPGLAILCLLLFCPNPLCCRRQ